MRDRRGQPANSRQAILSRWERGHDSLKDVPAFREVARRCASADGKPAHLSWYVDVEATVKAARLLKEVQGGGDFATTAKGYSEDPSSGPNGGDLNFQPLMAIENIDPRLAQAVQKMRVGETFPQVIETRFGFHIVKLLEKDAGGQKDLSDPRVQAQVRQVIFNRKDQTLKNAFSEAARNKATIANYLAERILETAGKSQ